MQKRVNFLTKRGKCKMLSWELNLFFVEKKVKSVTCKYCKPISEVEVTTGYSMHVCVCVCMVNLALEVCKQLQEFFFSSNNLLKPALQRLVHKNGYGIRLVRKTKEFFFSTWVSE